MRAASEMSLLLDPNANRCGKSADDRQQRGGRQQWGFVGQRVDDGRIIVIHSV